jgi:hypothetical protein
MAYFLSCVECRLKRKRHESREGTVWEEEGFQGGRRGYILR